jgi:hypothetical protein
LGAQLDGLDGRRARRDEEDVGARSAADRTAQRLDADRVRTSGQNVDVRVSPRSMQDVTAGEPQLTVYAPITVPLRVRVNVTAAQPSAACSKSIANPVRSAPRWLRRAALR